MEIVNYCSQRKEVILMIDMHDRPKPPAPRPTPSPLPKPKPPQHP